MVRISGSGGGKWYNNVLLHWWDQGPDYMHLKIENTKEWLSFYMLEPQHGRGRTMVDIQNTSNVDIFSVKSEGDYGVISMRNCNNIRLFGQAGNGMPSKGYSIIKMTDCDNFLLANIHPQHKSLGRWGALGTSHDPEAWYILSDIANESKDTTTLSGNRQICFYSKRH